MSAANRFSTPPRAVMKALPTPSPVFAADEFLVDMVTCITGQQLGELKVSASTRLMDVRAPLIAAMGGGINKFEIHLLDSAGTLYESAHSTPFANASPHDVFQVIKTEMEDMIYMDMDRDERRRLRA